MNPLNLSSINLVAPTPYGAQVNSIIISRPDSVPSIKLALWMITQFGKAVPINS